MVFVAAFVGSSGVNTSRRYSAGSCRTKIVVVRPIFARLKFVLGKSPVCKNLKYLWT